VKIYSVRRLATNTIQLPLSNCKVNDHDRHDAISNSVDASLSLFGTQNAVLPLVLLLLLPSVMPLAQNAKRYGLIHSSSVAFTYSRDIPLRIQDENSKHPERSEKFRSVIFHLPVALRKLWISWVRILISLDPNASLQPTPRKSH